MKNMQTKNFSIPIKLQPVLIFLAISEKFLIGDRYDLKNVKNLEFWWRLRSKTIRDEERDIDR